MITLLKKKWALKIIQILILISGGLGSSGYPNDFNYSSQYYHTKSTHIFVASCNKFYEIEQLIPNLWISEFFYVHVYYAQWISLLCRRVQKIEQIQPDHCDIYQKNHNKKCNWMALVSYIGFGGNISQISLKCRKSLNLIKLLKSWQFIISLKTFGGLINYFK